MTGSLLITGGTGFLGNHLVRTAAAADWRIIATHLATTPVAGGPEIRWERLDSTNRDAVVALVDRVRPDVVVHAATGRHNNDWAPIADGAANVAVAATSAGARLVHVSSDAVLSGTAAPYDESAPPDPVNRYGAAKAAAETAVRAIAPGAAVVRVPLIVGGDPVLPGRTGARGSVSKHERLVHALHDGAAKGALFADRYRMPVAVGDLAAALLELAGTNHAGVLNVAGADVVSWYELGRLIAERDGLDPDRLPSGRAAEHGVVMPADTRLDTSRACALLTTRLRGAREFLARR